VSTWIDPVVRALDARTTPLTVFFRDDDAGWGDGELFALLALFERLEMPIDLAVIPDAIAPATAARLAHRARLTGLVGLHQHGFAHANHEPSGRPSEFGPSRAADAQRRDIVEGRQHLLALFGGELDPIFTPPWNRCVAATAVCLLEAGIPVLSRDRSAEPLGVEGLIECRIASDWLLKRKGLRVTRDGWAIEFANAIVTADAPVGVMLHHAVMDDEHRDAFGTVLMRLRRHARVHAMRMRDAAAMSGGAQSEGGLR
jgi:predicted deacetylase